MAKIIVQTDDRTTVESFDFPIGCTYATYLMPGCPENVAIHNLLNRLKRALEDAEQVQRHGQRGERLSEQVMRRLAESEARNREFDKPFEN